MKFHLFCYKVSEEAEDAHTEQIISPKLPLAYMLRVEQTSQLVSYISYATELAAQF